MDKVKAIKVLKPLVDSYVDYANITMKEEDGDIVDALEMAIEALKALDVPDMNVGDMISRQMAIDALAKFVPYAICDESTESYTNGLTDACNLICQLPSAQPRKNGEWIVTSEFEDCRYVKCNQCKVTQVFYYNKPLTNFCPNCGADMRGEEND